MRRGPRGRPPAGAGERVENEMISNLFCTIPDWIALLYTSPNITKL